MKKSEKKQVFFVKSTKKKNENQPCFFIKKKNKQTKITFVFFFFKKWGWKRRLFSNEDEQWTSDHLNH